MKKIFLITIIIFLVQSVSAKAYKGAEYRTKAAYTYGKFEVRMKSAQREGMLSSFFTYHEITSIDNWNEIDIEILGRYNNDVQFNPITPGQVNHASHYQLPFNPALEFHVYGFEWTPTYVAWFVDGKEVHRQTGAHIEALNLPQKIMMNIWNPEYANWAGVFNENVLPAFAYYDWVSYSSYTPGTGNTGTGNNFTFQWKDDFDSWDQTRWEKATHTFGGNGCDFIQANAVFEDGKLILCLTKETAIGYVDNVAPNVLAIRAEKDGVLVLFSEEVDSVSAVNTSNYIISGKTISSAVLYSDQKSVKLTVANYDTNSLSNILIFNIKDRWKIPNTISAKNITITKTKPLSFPVKINCAGAAYKDYLPDQAWSSSVEYGYMDGNVFTNTKTITGTIDPVVFNSELNDAVKYRVRVPNGTYTVILMMAENYFTEPNKRIFSISVQGKIVETNLDLYAKVGMSKSYQKPVANVVVTEGVLDIHFMATVDRSLLNGIQIIPVQVGVNQGMQFAPSEWNLGQNFPNPFNGSTIIPITLTIQDNLTLKIFDTLGRVVDEIALGTYEKGNHQIRWNARKQNGEALSSGAYWYLVQSSTVSATRKMILIQ